MSQETGIPEPFKISFPCALHRALDLGCKIARSSWKGKQWVCAGKGDYVISNKLWNRHTREFADQQRGGEVFVNPYLILKTEAGAIQMGWTPSQEDIFANDWFNI
jgi:hypothetical protein